MVVAALVAVGAAVLVMSVAAVAAGPISWRAPVVIDHPPPYTFETVPVGVSCPTESFCALIGQGDVITSTDPTGGLQAWGVTQIESGRDFDVPSAISCPSTGLCVVVDNGGNVFSSTDPGGGAAAWKVAHVEGGSGSNPVGFASVSCPTASLCVAVDRLGNVASSTDPTGGANAWRIAHVNSNGLERVACPSESLCVAVDDAGHVVTSTDPTAGAGAWAITTVDEGPLLTLSCASATLCVAGDGSGNVVSSANPTGGAGAWSLAHVDTAIAQCTDPSGSHPCQSWLSSISCPSQSLCVAGDGLAGAIMSSSNPTGGASAWTFTPDDANAPLALSCPTVSLCVGGSGAGVLTSTDPTGGAGAWTAAPVGAVVPLGGFSCPTASLCVATDDADRLLISTDPTAPDPVWSTAAAPTPYGLVDVTCVAPSFCVGFSGRDQILTSTNPAGGASAWTDTNLAIPNLPILSGVSCPSVSLCVAVDDWGGAFVSRNPTGGAPAWTRTRAESQFGNPMVDGVSCPSVSLCVAVDLSGDIITSTAPAARRPTWRVTHVNAPGGLASVSCPSISLCVAADPQPGGFFVSTHPAGGASSWRMVRLSGFAPVSVSCATPSLCVAIDQFTSRAIASADPSGGAASCSATQIDINYLGGARISCNWSFCIVGDDVGGAVLGFPAPRPTPAQLRRALRKQLVPSARHAAFILKRGGYLYSFRIPAPGQLSVSWYTSGARSSRARRRLIPILIATANAYIGADTTDKIKLHLTRQGRLLRHAAPLTVIAEAHFTTAQHTVAARAKFILGSTRARHPPPPAPRCTCPARSANQQPSNKPLPQRATPERPLEPAADA
jgi:hypothetical protein